MNRSKDIDYWFVGAMLHGNQDQTEKFVQEGVWENGYRDKFLDDVRAMKVGDKIAIKAAYTRKHGLPFENNGNFVSVMSIKAIGTITDNKGDGRHIGVDWELLPTPREWYFYTSRQTVWHPSLDSWETQALVAFAFENQPQDIDKFLAVPYWRDRYAAPPSKNKRFEWTKFYEAVADQLLTYKEDRSELIKGLHDIAETYQSVTTLEDRYEDGSRGPLKDIDPFTVMGIFNRGLSDANRKAIAGGLAEFLGVSKPVPEGFEAIPVLNNQKSWFFSFATARQADDIDRLWRIFEEAIAYADGGDEYNPSRFVDAYNDAIAIRGIKWNITMGLYWIRPWSFPTLESLSRQYMRETLALDVGNVRPDGEGYLKIKEDLDQRFKDESYPVNSYLELSLAAWNNAPGGEPIVEPDGYDVEEIIEEGCFLSHEAISGMLNRLSVKKNVILQGPPGTGKTWLARRLAYALVGERNSPNVKAVQFHPNMSYEDFIRGWRPEGDGKLNLVDGPFLEMVSLAKKDPSGVYVLVIEEINRGNPAQIFGELLTLLEADKRDVSEALELCYRKGVDEKVYIPENLYVIGTMNIADRSLALVDLALRRRFAFVDLVPQLGSSWLSWVRDQFEIDEAILTVIQARLQSLNEALTTDVSLGKQFQVGHSYVTPTSKIKDARAWFRQVVDTEIGPLLEEYYFDAPDKAQTARQNLLAKI